MTVLDPSSSTSLSLAEYQGDGTTDMFSIPFDYIDKDDIHAYIDEDPVPIRDFISSSMVKLEDIPPSGSRVLIVRRTYRKTPLVDFQDGSTLLETDLDLAVKQLLLIAQEGLGSAEFAHQELDRLFGELEERVSNLRKEVTEGYQEAIEEVTEGYQEADANIQDQLTGETPLEASAFSPISWHDKRVKNSVTIPEGVNAWSFGPHLEIANGSAVEVGEDSNWTIAEGGGSSGSLENYDEGEL